MAPVPANAARGLFEAAEVGSREAAGLRTACSDRTGPVRVRSVTAGLRSCVADGRAEAGARTGRAARARARRHHRAHA